MDLRLTHVAQAIAVARTGSFTAAAKEIGITQSAITRGVADLERQIGYDLFHRTSRRVLLTDRGRIFVESAERLLIDARALLSSTPPGSDSFSGTLRVGICPAALEWRLFEPVTMLQRKHPALRFELSSSNFERMIQSLQAGNVDIAVGFTAAFSEWPELQLEHIPALNTTLFARNGHPILKHDVITPEMFVEYDLVLPSGLRPHGAAFQAVYENNGVDWRRRIHVIDYFPITKQIVSNSDTLAVAPCAYVNSARMKRRFSSVQVQGISVDFSTPMCCAIRARWRQTPAAREFITATRNARINLVEPTTETTDARRRASP